MTVYDVGLCLFCGLARYFPLENLVYVLMIVRSPSSASSKRFAYIAPRQGSLTFPSNCQLIAAMNLCACGSVLRRFGDY